MPPKELAPEAATLVAPSAPLVVKPAMPAITPAVVPPVLVRVKFLLPPVTAPRLRAVLALSLSTALSVSVMPA